MNFDYIECQIISNPVLAGFQIRVYPYLVIRTAETQKYFPITGLYTQEQYAADANGTCTLLKTLEMESVCNYILQEINTITVESGTLLVVHYSDNESKKEAYRLSNGKLLHADDEVVMNVLNGLTDENYIINLNVWPVYKQDFIETLKSYLKNN